MANHTEPVEVQVLQDMSDKDANYIASWMAEAFYRKDAGPYYLLGKTYEEDTELHRLFFRAALDRGSVCGQLLTTKDRNAFRVQFRPGQENKILDLQWRSGKDDAWDMVVMKCGGADIWGKHLAPALNFSESAEKAVYGEDGCLKQIRSMFFGVKPGCQGQGIGRAIQNHTVKEAEERGVKFFFWTNMTNLPLYENLGCKGVSTGLDFGWEVVDGYPKHSNMCAIMEAVRTT